MVLDRTTLSEKYLRKLIGRADIEDALRRLDQLTQEEARMATMQVLKATRIVGDGVRGVHDQVAGVDGRVKAIDGKVAKIIDGMNNLQSVVEKRLILMHPDGDKAKVVIQQTADDVDQAKRSSTFNLYRV